jgi:hypothetical protein
MKLVYQRFSYSVGLMENVSNEPFKDEAPTTLFKYPVRTAL